MRLLVIPIEFASLGKDFSKAISNGWVCFVFRFICGIRHYFRIWLILSHSLRLVYTHCLLLCLECKFSYRCIVRMCLTRITSSWFIFTLMILKAYVVYQIFNIVCYLMLDCVKALGIFTTYFSYLWIGIHLVQFLQQIYYFHIFSFSYFFHIFSFPCHLADNDGKSSKETNFYVFTFMIARVNDGIRPHRRQNH